METIQYDPSSAIALSSQARAALASAADIIIDSPTMYELASDELRQVKTLQKRVEEQRTTITGPLNQAIKAINDLFRAPKEFLEQAESGVKRAMVTYTTEQERIAAEARRQAEVLLRAERERLAQVEREQQAAARAAEEAVIQANRQAAAAAAAGDEKAAAAARKVAQEQAEAAEAAQEAAESAAMTSNVITITPTATSPAKVAGISARITYGVEVTDLMALVMAVAEGKAPIQCLQADEKFLGAQARAFKKPGPLFPGVVCYAEHGIAARSA